MSREPRRVSFEDLKSIKSPKLHLVDLEVVSEENEKAEAKVATIVGYGGLDILVNNAGVFHPMPIAGEISPKDAILNVFEVNSVAPLLIVNKFHGLLKKAAARKGSAQIANISSVLGSLEKAFEPADRPPVVYAMSKAAMNMLTRKISLEFREDKIRATAFCPGWVRTDVGTEFAALDLDESTGPLSKLILALKEEHNGLYYRYDGIPLPW